MKLINQENRLLVEFITGLYILSFVFYYNRRLSGLNNKKSIEETLKVILLILINIIYCVIVNILLYDKILIIPPYVSI